MTEFKKFRVGDLFEVSLSDGDNKIDQLKKGEIPLISSGGLNNGIVGYVRSNTYLFPKDSISVDMFGNAFFQPKEFYAVSHGRVSVLTPKFSRCVMSDVLLYIVTSINKITNSSIYGFSNMLSSGVLKKLMIDLPVTSDGSPDWQEMESVVDTVEQQHVDTVDKTLSAAGFSSFEDTVLTDDEEILLKEWINVQTKSKHNTNAPVPSALRMGTVKLGDLFEIIPSKYYSFVSFEHYDLNTTPVISNTLINNGVVGYTSLNPLENGNRITVSDTVAGAESMFYQKNPFIGYSHIQVLRLLEHSLTENIAMYIITCVKKVTKNKYNYGTKFNRDAISNTLISLPINNKNIVDFEVINSLGIIFKKLSVQGLRKDLDEKLSEYKKVSV